MPVVGIQLASMIDCIFLLLTYFVITASFQQQERELPVQLPGVVEQQDALEFPDEQIIEIDAAGNVWVNEYRYDSPESVRLPQLRSMLKKFQQTSAANRTEPFVTIMPQPVVTHQRIVQVLDAVRSAGILAVGFVSGE